MNREASSDQKLAGLFEEIRNVGTCDLRNPNLATLSQQASALLLSQISESHLIALFQDEATRLNRHGNPVACALVLGAILEHRVTDALPTVNQLLANPSAASMHEDIAEALGDFGDKTSVPFLEAALDSPEVWVRAKAGRSLSRLAGAEAVAPLSRLLEDDSDTVRENAIRALAGTGSPKAFDPLKEIATNEQEDTDIRGQAVAGLGKLGDQKAVPVLKQIHSQAEDEDLRAKAANALSTLQQANTAPNE